MTVSARKIAAFSKLVAGLADLPNLGSTALLKQWFDSSPEELRVSINGLIDDLISAAAGASGTEQIGSAAISGVAGATAYAQLVDLKSQLNGVVLGQIPPDMLTNSLYRQSLINGNFDVWQRGTSFTVDGYTADRWNSLNFADGGVLPAITRSRQQFPGGFLDKSFYYYQLSLNGAGSSLGTNSYGILQQLIEFGTRYLCGAGKKVTVSFWARSSIVGKRLGITMVQFYGSGGSPSASDVLVGTNFTLTPSFQKYSFTFSTATLSGKAFGSNNDDSLALAFYSAWGSSRQGIVGAATPETFGGSGTIDIAQVQFNAGDIALPLQPKSYNDELMACKRYCHAVTDSNNANFRIGFGSAATVTLAFIGVSFPTQMRVAPTLVATATEWQLEDGANTPIVLTAIAIYAPRNNNVGTSIRADVAAGLTIVRPYELASSAVGKRMIFDAEL